MHRGIVASLCLLALSAAADHQPAVEVRFKCLLPPEKSALKTKNVDRAEFHRALANAIADQGNANFGFLEWTSTETKSAALTLVVKLEEREPNSALPEYVVRYYLATKDPDGKVVKEDPIGWLGGQTLYTPGRNQFYNPSAYEKDLACRAWSDFTSARRTASTCLSTRECCLRRLRQSAIFRSTIPSS